jgi:NADPH:quinone reductase-like Zn-dependent oxidoreductase
VMGLKLRPSRRRVRIYMITMTKGCKPADCKRDWEHLLQLYLNGVVDPIVGATFPMERAAEAHALMDRAGTRGKIVLLCGDNREGSAAIPP